MSIKINARETELKIGKKPGYYYVMTPELYIALTREKVIKEAALRSGVSRGVMQACWDAAGDVIKAWATEGHSVAIPGLGTMRFAVRAKAVESVNDVKTGLIKSRRIVFTPSVDLKDELANTAIQITCIDRNGAIVKRVTSDDSGTVEDEDANNSLTPDPSPEGEGGDNGGDDDNGGGTNDNENQNQNGGGDDNGGGEPGADED
jgi:predicted histone-like DNA-binding protein